MPAGRSTTRSSWSYVEILILLALGIGIGALAICQVVNPYDEGLLLTSARRILSGELPYRNYFAPYPPGQAYVVAAVFRVFGSSVLALRIYCIVVRAVLALVLYLLARRLAGRALAIACWGACVIWLTSYRFFGYPTFLSALLVLSSLCMLTTCAEEARSAGRPRGLLMFLAGGTLGISGMVRHDLVLYGLLASVPGLIVIARGAADGRAGPKRRPPFRPGQWWAFAAGFGVMLGTPLALLLPHVPFREVVFELYTYAFKIYPPTRVLPYPGLVPHPFGLMNPPPPGFEVKYLLAVMPFYAPLFFDLLGVVLLAARLRAHGWKALREPGSLLLASLLIFGTATFNLARVRSDVIHTVAMVLTSYVVAVAVARGAWTRGLRWRILVAAPVAGVYVLSLVWPMIVFPRDAFAGVHRGAAAVPCRDLGADRAAAAAYLRSVVPPGGRIFVGCGRHDKVIINEPIMYFLADRLPSTLYHQFDPGVTNTLEAQREIVNGLVRHRVEYLVLSTQYDDWHEPNASALSSGVTYLDDYLRSRYRMVRTFGPYLSIWKRSARWE